MNKSGENIAILGFLGWVVATIIGIVACFFAWGFVPGLAIMIGYGVYTIFDLQVMLPWIYISSRSRLLAGIEICIVFLWSTFFTYAIFQAVDAKMLGYRLDILLGLSCLAAFVFWFCLGGVTKKTA